MNLTPQQVSRRANWSTNPTSGIARPTVGGKVYEVTEGGDPKKFGLLLWPGEVTLAEEVAKRDWTGLRVVELECGTGLAGIVAAERGGTVTFLDSDPVVIERLRRPADSVCSDWSQYDGKADAVIASTMLSTKLAESILRIWTGKGPCLIVDTMGVNLSLFSRPLTAAGVEFSTQELTGKLENGTEYAVQLWTLSRNKV